MSFSYGISRQPTDRQVDEIGLRQMGAAGRVELVPPGMRVLVLSTDWYGPAVLGDPSRPMFSAASSG